MQSLWRKKTYEALETVTINGTILDLGGGKQSYYHQLIQGEHTFAIANLDNGATNDHQFDFEAPFPIASESFHGILCINVLEHIFNYAHLLQESHRVLKPDGQLIIAVPFLIRYHPSPNDYWRYTEATLKIILRSAGFSAVTVTPIGTGVCGAAYSLVHNMLRYRILQWPLRLLATTIDKLIAQAAPKSSFTTAYYPLGYLVEAKK